MPYMQNARTNYFTERKKMVLIGGGGHCKSVIDTIKRCRNYDEVVITDCSLPEGGLVLGCKVIGNDSLLPKLFSDGFTYAFITVGSIKNTDKRRALYRTARKIGFVFPSIADPSAVISDFAQIGSGVYIGKNAVINSDAVIGDMAIINTGTVVEHDCRVGDFVHIAAGAALCGQAEIGNDSFVGANATIIQGVKIGMNSIIGAGSVVLRDVPPQKTIVGFTGG